MSRFDKFRPRQPQVPAPASEDKSVAAPTEELQRKYLTDGTAQIPDQVVRVLSGRKGKFVFCLDATGSMATLIQAAKASLREIAARIAREAGCAVEIEIVAYRDYDMGSRIEEHSALTSDMETLIAFLNRIDADGGGADCGEAVEVALERALKVDGVSAVLLAGDEPAHAREHLNSLQRQTQLTAIELASRFAEKQVPIHTFVVGQRPDTIASFESIAQASGGKRGFLDGSAAMIDMAVMAMLATLKGAPAVLDYMRRNQLTGNASDFGRLLIEGPKR